LLKALVFGTIKQTKVVYLTNIQKDMQKIKNSSLSVVSSVLATAVIFSLASFAMAKNGTSAEKNTNNQIGQVNAEEHRSAVANFVRTLLKTANSAEGGIGEQVRVIAHQQNDSDTTTTNAIETIQSRSKMKTFLLGSDYKNLGALRSEMVKTRNRLEQLNRLMENVQNEGDKTDLQSQIQTLEQEQTKIENFIKEQEGKFSLFGWLAKMFNK